MLKGHVFSKQLFENPIFALFINTFLNGENGVSNNYKNGMQVTYSGSTLTIDSGAVCIQGRFIEEDTSTQIATGTNNAYCKLVIEIDLDKQNTESQLNQVAYKVITSASSYPELTQTNIVKNVSGIYQYELARFRTTASGITDFQDMRTFLDFDSIFEEIRQQYGAVLQELQNELASVVDGSDYLLKSAGGTVEGEIVANGGIRGNLTGNVTGNVTGSSGSCTGNAATATRATTAGTCTGNAATATRLQTARNITLTGDVTGSASFNGSANVNINANATTQTYSKTANGVTINLVRAGATIKLSATATISSDDIISTIVQLSDIPDWAKTSLENAGTIASAVSAEGWGKNSSESRFNAESFLYISFVKVDSSTYRMIVNGGNGGSSSKTMRAFITYLV